MPPASAADRRARRVLLVGWDAADWKTIMPLVNAGHMPALARLLRRGASGNLATLDPPLSPMLWTSIATGKTADEHGVLGFVSPRAGGGVGPVLGSERRVQALWQMADAAGLRSVVVGWWPSHPADAVAGAVVSNFYQRSLGTPWSEAPLPAGTVHPPDLAAVLAALRVHPAELTEAHLLPFVPDAAGIDQGEDVRLTKLARILADTASVHAAATYLMEETEWDFAAVYYDAIDHFGHGFMKYHPPQMPAVSDEDFARYRHVVTAGYRLHDMLLDRLLALAGDDTDVVLVSDHGFHSDHLRPQAIPRIPAGPAVEHRAFGVFAAAGPSVAPGARVYGAGLLDVAPTVLALLGLPAGEDMPGRVLAEAFETPPAAGRVPTWEPDEAPGPTPEPAFVDASEESDLAEAEAVRQLAALGYVEPGGGEGLAVQSGRDSRYYLARVHLSWGRVAEATDLLEALYGEAQPEFYGPWLARALLQAGRVAQGVRVLDEVEALVGPGVPMLGLLRAEAHLMRGQPEAALPLLDALAAQGTTDAEGHLLLARAFGIAGRPAEAEVACRAALARDGESARAHALLAAFRLDRGDAEGAAESALEAVGRLYSFPSAHVTLGQAFAVLGAPERAVQAFLVAAAQAPDAAAPHHELAGVYRSLSRPDLSAYHHSRALELGATASAQHTFGITPPRRH